MSDRTMNGHGTIAGLPWQVIIAVVTMAVGGLWAFAELKGDVRVLAERQEVSQAALKEIKRDIRDIRNAVAGPRDRYDGREP